MKRFARISLLTLWLFAIVVPSAITLFDIENAIVITNLNEEEQQETGKKNQDEEKIIDGGIADFSMIAQSKKYVMGKHHSIGYLDYTLEILLPPPEHIS